MNKLVLLLSTIFVAQTVLAADVTLAPGKVANINGTTVACKAGKDGQVLQNELNDFMLLQAGQGGLLGRCSVSSFKEGYTIHLRSVRTDLWYGLKDDQGKEYFSEYSAGSMVRALVKSGACFQ